MPLVSPNFASYKVEDRISFIRLYDPKVTAVPMMRHAVIRYRNTDKKAVERQAQMVTIPQIHLSDDYLMPEDAAKVFVGLLEDEQDVICRSLIDMGSSTISWDALTLQKVLESLTAVRVSNRLTREQIEGWAKIALSDFCNTRADQISNEKKYSEDQKAKQRAGTLNAYVELACKLAAPVPNLGQQSATALKNCMLIGKLDDDMAKVLLAKLEAILNPKIVENNDL